MATGSASHEPSRSRKYRRLHFGIVRKKGNPALLNHFRNPFLFVFERGHRIEVKSHNPWQSQVSSCGHQVREEKCRLTASAELHALHVRSMSRDTNQFHTRRNGTVIHKERPFPRRFQRDVIVQNIACSVSLVRIFRVLVFAALNYIARIWKRGNELYPFSTRVFPPQ